MLYDGKVVITHLEYRGYYLIPLRELIIFIFRIRFSQYSIVKDNELNQDAQAPAFILSSPGGCTGYPIKLKPILSSIFPNPGYNVVFHLAAILRHYMVSVTNPRSISQRALLIGWIQTLPARLGEVCFLLYDNHNITNLCSLCCEYIRRTRNCRNCEFPTDGREKVLIVYIKRRNTHFISWKELFKLSSYLQYGIVVVS